MKIQNILDLGYTYGYSYPLDNMIAFYKEGRPEIHMEFENFAWFTNCRRAFLTNTYVESEYDYTLTINGLD